MKKRCSYLFSFLSFIFWIQVIWCSDITNLAFGSNTNIKPAAFGDFNSDELTDLFVIADDKRTVKILLGSTKEPLFSDDQNLHCTVPVGHIVTSVVPGDFDGDALLDFLITTAKSPVVDKTTYVFVNWGNMNRVNCSTKPVITMIDEPLVIDYDQDMIADLFGQKNETVNAFWTLSKNLSYPKSEIFMDMDGAKDFKMRLPHSHAYVDVNDDNSPDLYLTGEDSYGIWLFDNGLKKFVFSRTVPYPESISHDKIGQNLFMDLETADSLHLIVPVCGGNKCSQSAIYVWYYDKWFNLNVSFRDYKNKTWTFVPNDGHAYTDTITLRPGDFNNDGYIDMLATLQRSDNSGTVETFLLENVLCSGPSCNVKRTFEIQWNSFTPWNTNAIMGTFYDFMQDGILDIIFVHTVVGTKDPFRVCAFKNDIDYDANFIKVMVISALKNKENEASATLLNPKSTFGTSLCGPKIQYKTTTQDGNPQAGVSVQLPQSAHFALHLPFTIFGLGRTPNFIEDLTIGIFNQTRTWNQIIPNSQLVVIPSPPDKPASWRAQLFVTPSKIVWQTAIALAGTCVVIAFIIGLLHWKERREDRIEKLQEAHRFHFDAM